MKLSILKIFLVAILFITFTIGTFVYAADNSFDGWEDPTDSGVVSDACTVSVTPDKTNVKPGEEITYELKVSQITNSSGIKMVEFYTGNYDSNIFECKVRNYNEDKWSLVNTEGYITISSTNSEAWKTDETLAKIIYTPKTGVANNKYTVSIDRVRITTGDDLIFQREDLNKSLSIRVGDNYSCTFTFTPDKTIVKPGEEIAFDVKVSNINAGNGLKMVEFYLGNYDSTKFDCKISNYNEDKWSLRNTEGYITISANNSEAWKTDETLAKIIYTPKTGLADNTYQTKIANIKATTDDDTIITMADTNLNIKVETPQNPSGGTTGGDTPSGGTTGGDTQGDTQGGTSQGGDTPSGSTTDGTTQSDGTARESTSDGKSSGKDTAGKSTSGFDTSSESKSSTTKLTGKESNNKAVLPYSGDTETIMIILGIVLFTATSSLFYIRYKKFDI